MAIKDEAATQEVSFWEKALAKRWIKVLNVLLTEGDEDAVALLNRAEAIAERLLGKVTR